MLSNIRVPRHFLLLAFLFLTLTLTGCAGRGLLAGSSWPGLSADETYAYVAFNQTVHAISLDNGRQEWLFPTEPTNEQAFFATPARAGEDLLIVGGYDGIVYALDVDNGSVVWTYEESTDRIIGGAAIVGDLALVPSADGALYALNWNDNGRLNWKFQTDEALWAAPLVYEDRVYLTSKDHNVYAITLDGGDLIWSQNLGYAMVSTPVLVDEVLLVGTFGSQLVAVDIENGEPLWSADAGNWVWASPAIYEDSALYGDVDGNYYSTDINSGNSSGPWQPDGPITASPVLNTDTAYLVVEDGFVYAINASNRAPIWPQPLELDGELRTTPVLQNDMLLVATENPENLIVFLDPITGNQVLPAFNAAQ